MWPTFFLMWAALIEPINILQEAASLSTVKVKLQLPLSNLATLSTRRVFLLLNILNFLPRGGGT